jgi:hypothetical protein
VGLRQNCGHTWNPNGESGGSRRKTWLWVLGWICLFPVPLTILLLRKKDMKPAVKYGIIVTAWLLFFVIGMTGNSKSNFPQVDTPSQNISMKAEQPTENATEDTTFPKIGADTQEISLDEYIEADVTQVVATSQTESMQAAQSTEINTEDTVVSETETATQEISLNEYIENIVDKYNTQTTEELVFVEDFTPSEKESDHYRTEFRLLAFNEAIGKSYMLGDKVVDLVASPTIFGEISFRVYTNNASLKQVIALIQGISPIIDKNLTATELQETVTEVSKKKTANGYYYGELGITLFGSDENGYELMIKND